MRILIAGATGAVGSRMVPILVAAGHDVLGTTRHEKSVAALAAQGATGIVMDPLDAASVAAAVAQARPDVIVHQLTALSAMTGNPKVFDKEFAMTNRLRTEGTDHLIVAARENGTRRFVAQSFTTWTNERTPGPPKTEEDPLVAVPGKEARQTLEAIRHLERVVTSTPGIDGLVMRYGFLYGPGQAASKSGAIADAIRKGGFPVVGGGGGEWSFVHIDDAAAATAIAVERGAPGIYNIVDDDPGLVRDWLPYLAEQLGGRKPLRLPAWIARPMLGEHGIDLMTRVRGSSNAKAKRELGWTPRYASWREGFRTGLG